MLVASAGNDGSGLRMDEKAATATCCRRRLGALLATRLGKGAEKPKPRLEGQPGLGTANNGLRLHGRLTIVAVRVTLRLLLFAVIPLVVIVVLVRTGVFMLVAVVIASVVPA